MTTNNSEFDEKLRLFRSHGMERLPGKPRWHYSISQLGMNYRLSDIQASLALNQLTKLREFTERRNEIADIYRKKLDSVEELILPPTAPPGSTHSYHLFSVRAQRRNELFDYLFDAGIGVQVHYVPIHHHPISSDLVIPSGGLPHSDGAFDQILSLPIYPGLKDDEQEWVVTKVKDFYRERP